MNRLANRSKATYTAMMMVVLATACIIAGCGLFRKGNSWLATYSGSPLTFSSPRDSADVIWERARQWFGGAYRPVLASDSDTLLESAETRTNVGSYIITMARSYSEGAADFVVAYRVIRDAPDGAVKNRAEDRAHELAYMAATSDSPQAMQQRAGRKYAPPIYDWRHP